MDFGHWIYPGEFVVDDWFGFIYRIIEKDTGKHYIGKKQFHSYTRKSIKGKKNKKLIIKENDWKTYTSSSTHVNSQIELKGKDNFIFLIESLHKTKGSLFYAEIELQVSENVLREKFEDGARKYYNGQIAGVKFLPPDEVSDETRMKISSTLKTKYLNKDNHWFHKMSEQEQLEWKDAYLTGKNIPKYRNKTDEEIAEFIQTNCVGENNPMFGKFKEQHPKYGLPMSAETKEKISKKLSGRTLSEDHKKNIRDGLEEWISSSDFDNFRQRLSDRMTGENNPMFGKPCYVNMTEDQKLKWKENISNSTRGKPKSVETKARMSEARKGKKKPTVICPHCNKEGASGNMTRYHFNNCKNKTK